MKAIHLASFNGNIGDSINHNGFWTSFRKFISDDVSYGIMEMREFYQSWGIRKFDQRFVDEVNSYDFAVIGGGNFFDAIWDNSASGTTIDITNALFSKIKVPVIFNGLGVDTGGGYSAHPIAREKFRDFYNFVSNRDNCLITVRNDGSKEILSSIGCDESQVMEIPDGGFFTTGKEYYHPELPMGKTIVTVNLACDKSGVRWPNSSFGYDDFCRSFALFLDKVFHNHEDIHVVFVPHIPGDLEVIMDVLKKVKDCFARSRLTVAPLLNGFYTPAEYITDLYRKSAVTIGMRYHSNICAIANGVPTIGIVTFDKHRTLYKKIGMEDRLFPVSEHDFVDELVERFEFCLRNISLLREQNCFLLNELRGKNKKYFEEIGALLRSYRII